MVYNRGFGRWCFSLRSFAATQDSCDGHISATPLWAAACFGHASVVRLLLTARADHTKPAVDGSTPYDVARIRNHAKVCGALSHLQADDVKKRAV